VSVCVSVCKHISGNTCDNLKKIEHVAYGCGSVLWHRCDTLCTSVDDIMFVAITGRIAV